MPNTIRVIVAPPGEPPYVREVEVGSFKTWYPLVDSTTSLLQTLRILPSIEILFDEEARMKDMPLNVLIPGRAPAAPSEGTIVIDMTDGQGMQPGEAGIGYHEILGTFLVSRIIGDRHVNLRDEDIKAVMHWIEKIRELSVIREENLRRSRR